MAQFLVPTPNFRSPGPRDPIFLTDAPNQFGIGLFILFNESRGRGWVDAQQQLVSDFLFKEGVSFSTITPHYENGSLVIDCAGFDEATRGSDLIRNYLYEEQYADYNRRNAPAKRTQFAGSSKEEAPRTPTGGKKK